MPRSSAAARRIAALSLVGSTLGLAAVSASADCVSGWIPGNANSNMSAPIRWLTMWDADGAGPGSPVLVAAGDFTGANSAGTSSSNYVASWDGTNWTSIGTGLNGSGYCLATLSSTNELFVCGASFSSAGGNPAKRIARWDGANWSDLATGTGTSPSLALLNVTSVSSDTIAVCGAFTQVGDTPANRVAAWSAGGGWTALGDGMSSTTSALIRMPNGDIVAGGAAITTGGAADVTLNRIGRWDGTAWHPLGDGLSGLVRCFAVMPNGDLIAGGAFLMSGSTVVNKIARWDGTTWSALGTGINTATSGNLDVFALAVMPNGDLIAAGDFTSAGGTPANRIARWRDGQWSALGAGVSAVVRDLEVMPDGNLAVGGDFTTAGGQPALRFAIWSEQSAAAITTEPVSQVVDVDASADFVLAATGSSLTYQWQQQDLLNLPDFIDIQDGDVTDGFGNVFCTATGATTNHLTLTNFTGVAQVFRCVVSNACSSVASAEVTLSFTPACIADFNGDSSVSVQDIFDFLAAYFSNDSSADVNGSGDVGVQDIFDYLAYYFAGCP